jgi:Cys-rich protein (TIGR01571 family)
VVEVPPGTDFSALLVLLEMTYGQKRIIEYQDFSGEVVRIDDALRWERFCVVADNSVVRQGRDVMMDVCVRMWNYEEPKLFVLQTSKEKAEGAARSSAVRDPSIWTSGLMQCSAGGFGTCIAGCLCPCMLAGEIGTHLGADWCSSCVAGLGCNPCLTRQYVRKVYGIEGSEVGDCCASMVCGCCSLCQMVTHLRQHKAPANAGGNSWPVGLLSPSVEGFSRRWRWTFCCSPCVFGEIGSLKGAQERPPCACAAPAGRCPGCCRSGCLLAASGAPLGCVTGAVATAAPLALAAAASAAAAGECSAAANAFMQVVLGVLGPLGVLEVTVQSSFLALAGVCSGVSTCVAVVSSSCCSIMCLALQSRTITRLQEGIDSPRCVCARDVCASMFCTSCSLVQEAAALGLWGNFAKVEEEEEDEEDEEDEDAAPKQKNCMQGIRDKVKGLVN